MNSPASFESSLAEIPREWLEEFEAAARRPLKTRMRYAFIRTFKPVLDGPAKALLRVVDREPGAVLQALHA